jgi:hypothetical protein
MATEKRRIFNHRLHRLRMGFGAWAGGVMSEGEARLLPRPRRRIFNRVGDRSALRRPTPRARTPTYFLICVICEICGLKILLFSLVRRLTGQNLQSPYRHRCWFG